MNFSERLTKVLAAGGLSDDAIALLVDLHAEVSRLSPKGPVMRGAPTIDIRPLEIEQRPRKLTPDVGPNTVTMYGAGIVDGGARWLGDDK